LFGVGSPVAGSPKVVEAMSKGREEQVGGKLEFEKDVDAIVSKSLAHIDSKRKALKLQEYDPRRYGQSGDARVLAAKK
ncbi:MAG: hypothetical protein Q8O40_14450, partial [Chloroflexota bacterium]|nr:hypothetical protein [Chloroflexota bacterium]